jgi:hypothetical protein
MMQGQTIRGMISAVTNFILRISQTPMIYRAESGLDIPLGVVLTLERLRHHDRNSMKVLRESRYMKAEGQQQPLQFLGSAVRKKRSTRAFLQRPARSL